MKKLYIACMAAMALGATSCMDFYPTTSLSEDQAWNSAENIQLFANQFYSYTPAFSTITSDSAFDGYINSDLHVNNSTCDYRQGTNGLETSNSAYTTPYDRIYYTSLLIQETANYPDQDEIATPLGEAYFFRALQYYNLVRYYGDVILINTPMDTDSPENYATRNDRTEVIDQALSDLDMAASLLPETSYERGIVNKYVALSLKARIALFEGTWQKFHDTDMGGGNSAKSTEYLTAAKAAALAVINSGNYKLFQNDGFKVTADEYKEAMSNYMDVSGMPFEDDGTNAGLNHDESYRVLFHLESETKSNALGLTKDSQSEFVWVRCYRLGYSNTTIQGLNNHSTSAYTRKMATMYLCDNGLPIYYNGTQNPRFHGFGTVHSEYFNRDRRMDDSFIQPEKPFWRFQTARVTWTDDEYTLVENPTANGTYMYTNAQYTLGTSCYYNYKWTSERQHQDRYYSQDYPVIRYAEVLLIYAEAAYELAGSITDADLDISLNLTRCRVNPSMPKLSNTLVSTNGLDMREEIRRERSIELAHEARRAEDIRRWAIAETVMNEPFLSIKYTGTGWESYGSPKYDFWPTAYAKYSGTLAYEGTTETTKDCIVLYDDADLSWSKRNYLLPIPSNQIQLNPNLGQNYGWDTVTEE
ncbi:MAG: RagB/SusD family nutrient uptake outer membrane protein [Rikenellaceae bacterium]